jgi:hypothetical protein
MKFLKVTVIVNKGGKRYIYRGRKGRAKKKPEWPASLRACDHDMIRD